MTPPIPNPRLDTPPPPPPPGLQKRVDAMSIHDLEFHLNKLSAQIRVIRSNPPAGRQADIDIIEGSWALIAKTVADRRAKIPPPPDPSDAVLTQAVKDINDEINQTGQN